MKLQMMAKTFPEWKGRYFKPLPLEKAFANRQPSTT